MASEHPPGLASDPEAEGFVAVIGMAGRFPGAADIEALWANLRTGTESLTRLPEPGSGSQPHVASYGILAGADEFDADYFGYSPAEALIVDPQQRVFLECAHEALERAGYGDPGRRDSVGVFAGGATTDYRAAVIAHLDQLPFVDDWQVRAATAPDFLATRVAHKLRLTGPAVAVQTACSTSLVAVHLAGQALLAGDCRLALAGGATVHVPHPRIAYTEGGIIAPDGHCRAFDAAAAGTVGASAAAVVVLKPLLDAIADGDHIHAVIRGSATNNDGGAGIGFTAPSVDGQARVIRAAQVVAGVEAGSIGYVEAHGTGTRLGDPIEVAALTKAFRQTTDECGYCAIGSVKSNLGHTDAAAGVVGLIKAVLAVEHGEIPPTLHVTEPHPQIDWAGSPFVVAAAGRRWQSADRPRRAGVSAFGVGGSNAHVVLEQPPPPPVTDPVAADAPQLLVSSASTPAGRAEAAGGLAAYLDRHPDVDLADVAWTLQVGRQPHALRQYAVGTSPAAGAAALRTLGAAPPEASAELAGSGEAVGGSPPQVVFLFPGQGGQHVGMAGRLYRHEPAFRARLAEVAALAAAELRLDLREVLYPPDGDPAAEQRARERLATIAVGQPAVFAVEYALAALLREWGIHPAAVVGHSLGAFAAACVAGVLPLADAVRLVVRRGELLQSLPAGAMVGVGLPAPEVTALLPPELTVAAVNGPGRCAVAGPAELVQAFAQQLQRRGVEARLLSIATAGHSRQVEPVVAEFRAAAAALDLRPAELPFLSDTTGDWAAPTALATAGYWATHLRAPVQFDRALATLAGDDRRVLLEVGPGRTLATLARQHPALRGHRVVATLPHPLDDTDDRATLLGAVGQLWSVGVAVDWPRLHPGRRRRVVLPTYPFARRRFLVPPAESAGAGGGRVVLGEPPADVAAAAAPAVEASAHREPAHGTPLPPHGRAAVREALRDAFGQALGIATVTVHDDLFQLGGDSLTAAKLAAWAHRRFGVPLSAADVVRARTAARCAQLVEEKGSGMFEDDDDRQYQVVSNDERQFSLWPTSHPLPAGWRPTGPTGTKAECLAAINGMWTDLRPASVQPRWLSRRQPIADLTCRIYCFPHSGGAAGEYLRWADDLPQLELWGVNLPGRGPRLAEPPTTSMTALASALVTDVDLADPWPADRPLDAPSPSHPTPYVLFGHSFGALLAYHVAQQLRERGAPPPRLLVLSGYPPPHLPRQVPVLSTLPDEKFLRRLDDAYGGVPAELLADRELATLVLPAYRADLAILESYQDPQLPPLNTPIVVVGGDQDRYGPAELTQWERHTTGSCQVRMLPGGHFYFRQQREPLLALLRAELAALAETP